MYRRVSCRSCREPQLQQRGKRARLNINDIIELLLDARKHGTKEERQNKEEKNHSEELESNDQNRFALNFFFFI